MEQKSEVEKTHKEEQSEYLTSKHNLELRLKEQNDKHAKEQMESRVKASTQSLEKLQQTHKLLQHEHELLVNECAKSKKQQLDDANSLEKKLQSLRSELQKAKSLQESEVALWKNGTTEVHAQLKCSKLTFPFAKDGYSPTHIPVKNADILVKADLTSNVKEIIEIVLDSSNLTTLDYSPGDTIAILPCNTEKEVVFLLEALELLDKANQLCQVQNNSKKNLKLSHIPERTTPKELLRDILNIRCVPKKQLLRALANCCTSKEEENFLNGLASKEGSHYYNELFLEKGLNLLDLLNVCVSCKPSLSLLIEHLPRLLPRPYSIANSPITHEKELKIIFSILNERRGVTTSMLASMAKSIINGITVRSPTVLAYPRQPNNFCYKADDFNRSQILIAIGTGVAPFLGFLEHKSQLLRNSTEQPGSTWLFVGATKPSAIPHRSKLLEQRDQHVLERYFESFSRVSDAAFHYVQDQLFAHRQELVEFFLRSEITLYVCAGSRISQAIESALNLCLQTELNRTEDECKELLKEFRHNGKYREDVWI